MSLMPHQKKCAQSYSDKAFLTWEGGTGKTIGACVWLRDNRDRDALVICPKRIIKKWKNELTKWQTKATVVPMDYKLEIKEWSAIVVDEADNFASPLFIKGTSKRSIRLYELIKAFPNTPIMLQTATPIRSTPWNLHTLLCFLGIYIDWKDWRRAFFILESRPFLKWPAWFKKQGWEKEMRPLIEKYSDVVLLKDCVLYLPPAEEFVIKSKRARFQGPWQELTPSGRFFEEHRHEQGNKLKSILEISKDFRKVLVVAYYVEQVEDLNKELSKYRQTFMVHGGTLHQEEILKEANEVDECFLIVQASLGEGFDADTFSVVIFVSMSYKIRDFVQMKFRVRRIHNLHPVRYYYLISGRCDNKIYETIQKGLSFIPSTWVAND